MGLFDRRDDPEIVRDLLDEAEESPGSVDVSQAVDLLESTEEAVRRGASIVVTLVAREHPDRVTPYVDRIVARLTDDSAEIRRNVTRAVSHVAGDDPAAVSGYADSIADRLTEDEVICRRDAARALRGIARASPEKIKPYVPDIEARLKPPSESPDETVIDECIHTLGVVAKTYPGAIRYSVDKVAAHAGSDSKETRTHVSFALSCVAKEHPEAVKPVLDALGQNLTDSFMPVRNNTVLVFRRVSREFPEAVGPYSDRIRDLAENDPDENVQRTAEECLSNLEGGAGSDPSQGSETQIFDPDGDF